MALSPSETEREGSEGLVPLHPDDPPPRMRTAEQLRAWQDLPEFEGLDPND